jgi:hypothetical protein
MTCAHRTRPFGSAVTVTHAGHSIQCRVNYRGPFVRGRVIDVSVSAARARRDGIRRRPNVCRVGNVGRPLRHVAYRSLKPASWPTGARTSFKSAQKMIDFIEANYARDNQVNCDNIVQKSGNNEDQDAS